MATASPTATTEKKTALYTAYYTINPCYEYNPTTLRVYTIDVEHEQETTVIVSGVFESGEV